MKNNSYNFIMRSLMRSPDCSLYALVDGLQYERHFGEEIKIEQGISVPFFNTWPDARVSFAGPWLYRLNVSEYHREKLKQLSEVLPAVSWFISSNTPENLVIHFKYFLNLQLSDGRYALFRFYDPRVLDGIELLLDEADYEQLISEVREWVYTVEGKMGSVKDKIGFYTSR